LVGTGMGTVAGQSEPPKFELSDLDTNSPIIEGENLTLTYNITNKGGLGTQTIVGRSPDVSDSDPRSPVSNDLRLRAGQTVTIPASVSSSEGDAGEYEIIIESENDTATTTVMVEDSDIQLSVRTPPAVSPGETVEIEASVTNTAEEELTPDVSVTSELGTDSESVRIPAGMSTNVTLSVPTTAEDGRPRPYTAEVTAGNESVETELFVTRTTGEFCLSEGRDGIQFSPGDPEAHSPIVFKFCDGGKDPSDYRWEFGDGSSATAPADSQVTQKYSSSGEYEVTATNGSRSDTVTVEVKPSTGLANVSVNPSVPLPKVPGLKKTIEVNVGNASNIERIEFLVDGKTIQTEDTPPYTAETLINDLSGGATVKVRAVRKKGRTVSEDAGLGVVSPPPLLNFLIENGDINLLSDAEARTSFVFPPEGLRSVEATLPVVGNAEYSLKASMTGVVATSGVRVSGDLNGKVGTPVAFGEVRGGVKVESDPSKPFTFDKTTLDFEGRAGPKKEVPLTIPVIKVGITPEVKLALFANGDATYNDQKNFPSDPSKTGVEGGIEGSGTLSTDVSKFVSAEGTVTVGGSASTEWPDWAENLVFTAPITAEGSASFPFGSRGFSITVVELTFDPPLGSETTSISPVRKQRTVQEFSVNKKTGSVPLNGETLPDDSSLVSAETGRITSDGLADESPSIIPTDTGYLLVWDRQANDRTVLEGHDIFLKEVGPDADWDASPRVRVTDDTTGDFDPDVAAGSNTRVLTWSRTNTSFADTDPEDMSIQRVFSNMTVAISTAGTGGSFSDPSTVAGSGDGSAYSPAVARGDGKYILAWKYDNDGNYSTRDDRGVKYATVSGGTVGTIETIPDATRHKVAGGPDSLRLAYHLPDTPGGRNGTVAVRDVTAGTTSSYAVTSIDDIGVTNTSLTWVDGKPPNVEVKHTSGGSVQTVGTGPVSAVSDLQVVNRRTATGEQASVLTFRGRAPGPVNSMGKPTFYRVRRGNSWTAPRQLSPTADLLFSQSTTAGRQNGLVSVFMGRNITKDQNHDLFFVRHEYGTDLNVTGDGSTNLLPGDSVTVDWTLRNDGAAVARNVELVVEDRTGVIRLISGGELSTVQSGQAIERSLTFQANRSRNVTVRVASSDGEELRTDNNAANVTVMRPDLRITKVDRSPATGGVQYNVTVQNAGPVAARDVTPGILSADTVVANSSVGDIAPGSTKTATLTVLSNSTNSGILMRVAADPLDEIAEMNETTGTRQISPPRPDVFVTDVGSSGFVDASSGSVSLNVTVGNRGFAGSGVDVKVNVSNQTIVEEVTLPGTQTNESRFRTVQLTGDGVSASPGQQATVRATPEALDSNPSDNIASTTLVPVSMDVELFNSSLVDRFTGPPTNTEELDPTLYEDLDGDGDGTEVSPTVAAFGELIRGNDLNGDAPDGSLIDEQARALNWNAGSPETEVTPADMVSLFGEKIRAD